MAKVFVSYSRKDIEFAKHLTAQLQKYELDFWIDWEGIPPTVDWWKEIEKGIEEADIFLFLISPDSARSKVCGREIETAVQNGKRIIPIVVREIDWEEAPPSLRHLNYIFFSRDDAFDIAVEKLMTAIHTDYEWAATHRRLQVKALEWERRNQENSFLLRGKDLQEAELQLTAHAAKDPQPTTLQKTYVESSRKASERQRNVITSISVGAAVLMLLLAIFGFYQASISRDAQAAAEEQSRIALNRQWAAEAQALLADPAGNVETATLLSLRALETNYTSEADAALAASLNHIHSKMTFRSGIYATWVAFSADGQTILVGNADSTVGTFTTATGAQLINKNLYNSPGNGSNGYSSNDQVIFPPSGKTVVIGNGTSGGALLFDLSDGKLLQSFSMHAPNEWVNGVALAPDGKTILTANTDGTARLWDISSGSELHIFGKSSPYANNANEWQAGWVNRVVYAPDGKIILTGDAQGVLHLWDISSGSELQTLKGHSRAITSLAFSPDGNFILSGSEDHTARLWDVTSGDSLHVFTGHTASVTSVAFSLDGKMILTGSADTTARLWFIATAAPLQVYAGHTNTITSVAFSPDGTFVLTGSSDGTARLWETIPQKMELHTFGGHAAPLTGVAFSPDGKLILAGTEDHTAKLWDLATGALVHSLEGHDGPVTSAAFSPDGTKILTGSEDDTVRLWNAQTGMELLALTGHTDWITSATFSPDGKRVLTGSYDGTARLWDSETGAQLVTYGKPANTQTTSDRYNNSITSVAFSPDGERVLTGSFGNSVKVWESKSGAMLLDFSTCMASSIAIAPNGESILVGCNSEEGSFLLNATVSADTAWQTGKAELKRFTHPPAPITSVAFSPAGDLVLTGGQDKIARLWNVNTGMEVRALVSHSDSITSVVFSPDGKTILSASADGTAQLWDTDYHDTIAKVCHTLTRDFTREERTKYNIPDNNPTCPNLLVTPQPIGL